MTYDKTTALRFNMNPGKNKHDTFIALWCKFAGIQSIVICRLFFFSYFISVPLDGIIVVDLDIA